MKVHQKTVILIEKMIKKHTPRRYIYHYKTYENLLKFNL